MAKDIKVTFKKDEEDIYEFIMLKGKGLYIKELIRKEMNTGDSSLDSGNLCSDCNAKEMLLEILKNTYDINKKLSSCNKSDNKNKATMPDNSLHNTDIANSPSDDNKYRIINDFSIDDLP